MLGTVPSHTTITAVALDWADGIHLACYSLGDRAGPVKKSDPVTA